MALSDWWKRLVGVISAPESLDAKIMRCVDRGTNGETVLFTGQFTEEELYKLFPDGVPEIRHNRITFDATVAEAREALLGSKIPKLTQLPTIPTKPIEHAAESAATTTIPIHGTDPSPVYKEVTELKIAPIEEQGGVMGVLPPRINDDLVQPKSSKPPTIIESVKRAVQREDHSGTTTVEPRKRQPALHMDGSESMFNTAHLKKSGKGGISLERNTNADLPKWLVESSATAPAAEAAPAVETAAERTLRPKHGGQKMDIGKSLRRTWSSFVDRFSASEESMARSAWNNEFAMAMVGTSALVALGAALSANDYDREIKTAEERLRKKFPTDSWTAKLDAKESPTMLPPFRG